MLEEPRLLLDRALEPLLDPPNALRSPAPPPPPRETSRPPMLSAPPPRFKLPLSPRPPELRSLTPAPPPRLFVPTLLSPTPVPPARLLAPELRSPAPPARLSLLVLPAGSTARFETLPPWRPTCCRALDWRLANESPRVVPPNLFAVLRSP